MAYNLIITDRADELIDSCVFYMINKLKNFQAHNLEDYPSKVME